MGPFPKSIKELCSPAAIYFIMAMLSYIIIVFQYMTSRRSSLLLGSDKGETVIILLLKFIFILFWTWVLNLICKDGHKGIAWFLVLFPFIVIGIILLMLVL